MSTVTMEIPKEQAEQIEMLAARANLAAMDVVALALQICTLSFDASRAGLGAGGAPVTAKDLVEALKHSDMNKQTYNNEQFISDLAQASLSGDAAAASAARARARASSIGFDSMADQPKIDGIAYQNNIRDAWRCRSNAVRTSG